MVIVQGKSPSPVYLWVYDDDARLLPAEGIWGKTVWETQDLIRAQTGVPDCVIASIGPAGENLVRIACIVNDLHRAAGRSGVGAVMGSKNLKAIAVRGTGSVRVASAERAMQAIGSQHGKLTNNPGVMGMQMYGTLEIMGIINETGGLPTRNHMETQFEGEEDINGEGCDRQPASCQQGLLQLHDSMRPGYPPPGRSGGQVHGELPPAELEDSGRRTGVRDRGGPLGRSAGFRTWTL